MRRAKIVCTIGPATESKEQLRALVDAGMDVARINRSHGSAEEHAAVYHGVREAAAILRAAGSAPGHIFNLGHGLFPTTPPENVAALVEAVHRVSPLARVAA